MDFSPNLSPKDVIQLGSFGGIYFYDNGGKLAIDSNEFPRDWFEGLDESQYKSEKYNRKVNYFKIKSGLSQEEWEEKVGLILRILEDGSSGIVDTSLVGGLTTMKGRFRDGIIFVERKEDGETTYTLRFSIKKLLLTTYHSHLQ